MKDAQMKTAWCPLIILSVCCLAAHSMAQGTFEPILITFEGPPVQPPGTGKIVQVYYESGMSFTPIDPNAAWPGFGRIGSSPAMPLPDNGTAYVQADLTATLKFSFTNGWLYSLLGVDLAEYSTVVPNAATVHFVGYRFDGSILSTDLTTDGIIDGTGPLPDFQTFNFDSRFADLVRVEVPRYGWSLDNLVFRNVPEPSAGALLLAGGLFLWAFRRCSR
jgi:hypothetical protein